MTAGQQAAVAGGISDPAISWVGQYLPLHEPYTKPTFTSADMWFRADGTYAYMYNAVTVTELGQFINPASGIAASNIQIIAQFQAGVTTYVTGPGLNVWMPLNVQQLWGVQLGNTGAPYTGNVILRFTLRNGYTGLQIGPYIDCNYDVQRV